MAEHMITELKKRGHQIHVRIITYFIHSKKRDFSFTPGLNSSLLKLSLLVNGSMPTSQCGSLINHNRQSASSFHKSLTWHLDRLTSCELPMTPGIVHVCCCVTNFALHLQRNLFVTSFWFSGKFCVDYVVESYSALK